MPLKRETKTIELPDIDYTHKRQRRRKLETLLITVATMSSAISSHGNRREGSTEEREKKPNNLNEQRFPIPCMYMKANVELNSVKSLIATKHGSFRRIR